MSVKDYSINTDVAELLNQYRVQKPHHADKWLKTFFSEPLEKNFENKLTLNKPS